MTKSLQSLAVGAALLSAPFLGAAAQAPRTSWPAIDSVFKDFEGRRPGCAVAVASRDTIIYEHGYGQAILEWNVPIGPATVFEIGSTSKQFTAMSVLALEHDGRLSLNDDLRKWIPELPVYGKPIRLYHLLHHTSGIRDYDPLLVYRGIRTHDVGTNADILDVLSRQRALNFPTGTRWQYSNSNYVLLAIVVERVSGQRFRDFVRHRWFEPLGMTASLIRDDHTEVIPNRARGYQASSDSTWTVNDSNWEETGDGSVQTNVRDLARWADNLRTGRVGGADLVRKMVQPGALDDGTPVTYAAGLVVDRWRGLTRVAHGGSWAGYRADLLLFPEPALSVLTTCNLGSANPSALALEVADRVLGNRLAPETKAEAGTGRTADVAGLVGTYWSEEEAQALSFRTVDGALAVVAPGGAVIRLQDLGDSRFLVPGSDYRPSFRRRPAGKPELVLRIGDRETLYRQVPPADTSAAALRALVGAFRSDELGGVVWKVSADRGKLVLRSVGATETAPLTPLAADAWSGSIFGESVTLRFVRAAGRVTGFTANGFALHGLAFRRI